MRASLPSIWRRRSGRPALAPSGASEPAWAGDEDMCVCFFVLLYDGRGATTRPRRGLFVALVGVMVFLS